MRGFTPNARIWKAVNKAVLDENAAEVIVTIISGLCQLLIHSKIAPDEDEARVHLAAMVLSPDDHRPPGSLIPRLAQECRRLDDGKWRQ